MYTDVNSDCLTLSSLALPALGRAQTINGVRLGVQTYSLRELPRPAGGDMVEPLIKGMTEIGFTECELWAPQIEPAPPFGRGTRPPEQNVQKAREELRTLARRDATRSLPGDPQEVRRGRHQDLGLQLQPGRPLHRRGDQSRLRDRQGARRRDHHRLGHARVGEEDRAVRREAPDGRRDAQPLEHRGPQRVRHARELRGGDEAVEVLQGQPRHRPLHRRELRRGRVPEGASRRASRTSTSRTARRTRATTCRGAPATRRSARCCSC